MKRQKQTTSTRRNRRKELREAANIPAPGATTDDELEAAATAYSEWEQSWGIYSNLLAKAHNATRAAINAADGARHAADAAYQAARVSAARYEEAANAYETAMDALAASEELRARWSDAVKASVLTEPTEDSEEELGP